MSEGDIKPPRILVFGDAGCHTGFASVIHNIFERIVSKHGADVHVLASNYRGDYWPTNLKLYAPPPAEVYGQSRFVEMTAKLMPDLIFILNDPAVVLNQLLNNAYDPEKVLWRGIAAGDYHYRPPIVAYLPVDGYDNPKSWDTLADRVTRVAMTHFGSEAMDNAPIVWHGVDTNIFKPIDKREAKVALGYDPDRFLVLRVDKNSTRKNYPDTWRALRPILARHSDIDVHFHCLPNAGDGYDLRAFAWNDEAFRDRLTFSPSLGGFTGWSEQSLATLYAAADLFVSTSWGEGFGLTLLEAMASGTPVVATDCSAITEVVDTGGVLIPPARRIATPMGQDQCLPDVDGFTAAIERLYLGAGSRRKIAERGIRQASEFSWDVAADKMYSIITKAIEANAT